MAEKEYKHPLEKALITFMKSYEKTLKAEGLDKESFVDYLGENWDGMLQGAARETKRIRAEQEAQASLERYEASKPSRGASFEEKQMHRKRTGIGVKYHEDG